MKYRKQKTWATVEARKILRKAGGYSNSAENEASEKMRKLGIEYVRRGYPDFTIMRDGEIVGFVEVKPNEGDDLRANQVIFKKFCERYGIPFMRWCPADGADKLLIFKENA